MSNYIRKLGAWDGNIGGRTVDWILKAFREPNIVDNVNRILNVIDTMFKNVFH